MDTSANMESKIESEECEQQHIKTEDTNSEHNYQYSGNIEFEEIEIKTENDGIFLETDDNMKETDSSKDKNIQKTSTHPGTDHTHTGSSHTYAETGHTYTETGHTRTGYTDRGTNESKQKIGRTKQRDNTRQGTDYVTLEIDNANHGKTVKSKQLNMPSTSSPVEETALRSMGETSRLRRHVTGSQMDALWKILVSHRDLATGYNKTAHARENSKRMWQSVAEALNSQGVGAFKDWKGWSNYWVDYKAKLKKRVAAERQSQSLNGGAPSNIPLLNEIDQKFLSLLGEKIGGGLPNDQVNPFPNLTQSSTSTAAGFHPDSKYLQETQQLLIEESQPQEFLQESQSTAKVSQPQEFLQKSQSIQGERITQTTCHVRQRQPRKYSQETRSKIFDLRKYRLSLVEKQTQEMHEQTIEMRKQREIMQQMLHTLNKIANKRGRDRRPSRRVKDRDVHGDGVVDEGGLLHLARGQNGSGVGDLGEGRGRGGRGRGSRGRSSRGRGSRGRDGGQESRGRAAGLGSRGRDGGQSTSPRGTGLGSRGQEGDQITKPRGAGLGSKGRDGGQTTSPRGAGLGRGRGEGQDARGQGRRLSTIGRGKNQKGIALMKAGNDMAMASGERKPGMAIRKHGATSNVVEEIVPIPSTPSVRQVVEGQPLPSLISSVEERVEAMDFTDDEADFADKHVMRWVGWGLPEPTPITPSNATDDSVLNASGDGSPHLLDANVQPENELIVTPVDDVYPSRSGVTKTFRKAARRTQNDSDFDSDFDDEFDINPIDSTAFTGIGREIPNNEELDESVRNIITSIETAMDEATDCLLGTSTSFVWEEGFETFRGVREQFSGPTPGPLKDYDTPYDAFTDIWSRDIMEHIAQETNRYASQTIGSMRADGTLKVSSRLHHWNDTDADEMMGISQRSSQDEYWKDCGCLTLFGFKELMTYDRYVLLSRFLHFVDDSDVGQDYLRYEGVELSPKLAKIAPVISHLGNKFSSLYNLQAEVSIDESLTLFKRRLSWVQAIRSKAARLGFKSFELCESRTGYLYKFQIYTGKTGCSNEDDVGPSSDLGSKSTKVVLELLKGLENRGHCVTMDNFYNCPALARYLKSLGIDCLGTLRVNRKNVPNEIAKVSTNVPKGTIISRQCGDVSIISWKDSKLVTMISTFHRDDTYVGSRGGKPLVKPVCVRDYNSTMGGVDLKDQKLSMYLLERKRCLKWYIKIFKRLLNVSIHNAFVMYVQSLKRRGKLTVTHREFRYALANSLAEKHRRVPPVLSQSAEILMRLRKDVVHVPKADRGSNNRKRCVIHQRLGEQKQINTKCVTCGAFLCFSGDCWKEWHTLTELKGRNVHRRKRKLN